jgi:hypothetical protein
MTHQTWGFFAIWGSVKRDALKFLTCYAVGLNSQHLEARQITQRRKEEAQRSKVKGQSLKIGIRDQKSEVSNKLSAVSS